MIIKGAIVDASVTRTLRKPRGKREFELLAKTEKKKSKKNNWTDKFNLQFI